MFSFALALAAASLVSADEPTARSVQIVDADGKVRHGVLAEMGAGQVTLGLVDPVRLKTRNLVRLSFRDRTSRLEPGDPLVVLNGGDVLAVVPESIDDEALRGRWARAPELPAVRVPLESVRGILFNLPAHSSGLARLLDQVLDGDEPHDTVILNNGDALSGEFSALNENDVALTTAGSKSVIERSGVRAVIFNPSLTSTTPLRGEGALVALVNGSRFRARDLKFAAPDRLLLSPQFGGELQIALAQVESLRFLGGCATYLSDLAPAEYRFEPFFELEWPLRRDRAVAGGFLNLRGVEYPKGLGMHSRSTVTYRLDGKFRRFHATIGIDDVTAGKGSVVFEVVLDGKVAYKSDLLTGSSAAATIDHINLTGVKSLALRVDFGDEGDIQDHADWCDAIIVK